jgi:hypothetical protein
MIGEQRGGLCKTSRVHGHEDEDEDEGEGFLSWTLIKRLT